jgi:excisionase family DNA binding protein
MGDDERRAGAVLVTVCQAAELLAIGRTSVYDLIGRGELEVVRIGRSIRIPVDAVHHFVERRRVRMSQAGANLRS